MGEEAAQVSQVVTFRLGSEEYGLDIMQVREIIRTVKVTRIPDSPPGVQGVIDLRDEVLPVLNLRQRFGLPEAEEGESSRIVIVNPGGSMVGLTVDSVSEVLRVPEGALEPVPDLFGTSARAFLRGIVRLGDRMVTLVNLGALIDIDPSSRPGCGASAPTTEDASS